VDNQLPLWSYCNYHWRAVLMVRQLECREGVAACRCGFSLPCSGMVYHQCIRRGLGDLVAAGLAAVGITPERVAAVTGKPCKCKQRQKALNELGRSIGIG
jgi:hypothetical protein